MKNCVINMIEAEKPTPNDFNYYDIVLEMEVAMEIIELL
jgi:hypothetical protein